MHKLTQRELDKVLNKHEKWLLNGKGKQAFLANKDLSHLDLSERDLTYIHFTNSNLSHANLRNTILDCVVLDHCILHYTDFKHANFNKSYTQHADLSKAYVGNSIGDNKRIYTLQLGYQNIVVTKTHIAIGNYQKPITLWKQLTMNEIDAIGGTALIIFWSEWKEFILNFAAKISRTR